MPQQISREDIAELTERLMTAYLDSLFLLRQRSQESEDAKNVEARLHALLYDGIIREFTETDIKKAASDIQASPVLKWFFTRMIVAIRATSIENLTIDRYIASTYAFYPLVKMENEYAGDTVMSNESSFVATYDRFPFMKVLALFEMLNICQEMEFRRVVAQDEE